VLKALLLLRSSVFWKGVIHGERRPRHSVWLSSRSDREKKGCPLIRGGTQSTTREEGLIAEGKKNDVPRRGEWTGLEPMYIQKALTFYPDGGQAEVPRSAPKGGFYVALKKD